MRAKLENGKLIVGGKILRTGKWVISNPREQDYIDAGYKLIVNNPPADCDEKEYNSEYTETEDKIIINYREV